jgi:Holliday junction resolvase-like predicted endonuclease
MTEQKIQAKIIKWLEANGHYVVKIITASKAGIPDLIVCTPAGGFVGIEVKTKTGVSSALQKVNIRKINQKGGRAFIARSLDDVKRLLTATNDQLLS